MQERINDQRLKYLLEQKLQMKSINIIFHMINYLITLFSNSVKLKIVSSLINVRGVKTKTAASTIGDLYYRALLMWQVCNGKNNNKKMICFFLHPCFYIFLIFKMEFK